MSRYRVTVEGRRYYVDIDDPHARPVSATVSGTTFSVDVEPADSTDVPLGDAPPRAAGIRQAAPAEAPAATAASGDPDRMIAPIPGVVSSIAVAAGQTVARGDELLTLEAMKMMNVIRSPRDGRIDTVHVAQGSRVAQGEPLVSFEP